MKFARVLCGAVVATASITMATGCASVSRGLGKVTANKYAEPRSGTVWVVPPPQLEPPSPNARTVYISFRNIIDAQDIQLLDDLKSAAREQGWTVVNDPNAAKYRLRSSLRYFGEVEPGSGGASVGRDLGGIAGAATGIAVGVGVNNATDSALAGVGAGFLSGGLVAAGLSNASRPREWALIIDFVLEEYTPTPVTFTMQRSSGSASASASGYANSRASSGGADYGANSSSGTIEKTSNYFPHGVRLSAWANQMAMEQEEAMPLIMERTQRVVTQILPM